MKKAIIFDLFETLITEWGHEKYTKHRMSEDLGCPPENFAACWESLHEQLGVTVSEERLAQVTAHRMKTKSACFDFLHPEIIPMLKKLREQGYWLAILSNCSEEEVTVVRDSPLASLMDVLILSHETGLCKPQPEIYRLAAERLGVTCEDCIYIGDGGSRELYGAREVGMQPYRAMWYIRQMPTPIKDMTEFEYLENPAAVLTIL